MAVAVKNAPETATRSPLSRLAVASMVGVGYVLGSLALVFYGIPAFWDAAVASWLGALGQPVSVTLMILVMAAAALGLVWLAPRVIGPNPPHGLRAGIFFGIVEVIIGIGVVCGVGSLAEARWPIEPLPGAGLTVGLGIAWLVLVGWLQLRPQYERAVIQIEDQGWFSVKPYKRTQGQRVRRGTIIGILILGGCGIYTMMLHDTLAKGAPSWQVAIPFSSGHSLVLLPDVKFTLPLLLSALTLWLAYRIVNLPVFADFLIATEAELNKVSWTTRKRLIQDTVVVMVTVILLTVFLFLVDQTWGFVLSKLGVLQISPTNVQETSTKEQSW
jgi:preprotein translocase SecE subunit